MISALEVWALSGQGGAPSLYKTLAAYAARGHEVDFVSATIGANHHHGAPVQEPPAIEGVRYHHFHLPSLQESRLPLPGPAATVDQKLRFALLFPELAARKARRLAQDDGLRRALRLRGARRARRRAWCARHESPAAAWRDSRARSCTRISTTASAWRARYEEVMALKTPADLYVMTDDGTQGDRGPRATQPRVEAEDALLAQRPGPAARAPAVARRDAAGARIAGVGA